MRKGGRKERIKNEYSIEPQAFKFLDDYDWIPDADYRELGALEGTYKLTKDDIIQFSVYNYQPDIKK